MGFQGFNCGLRPQGLEPKVWKGQGYTPTLHCEHLLLGDGSYASTSSKQIGLLLQLPL